MNSYLGAGIWTRPHIRDLYDADEAVGDIIIRDSNGWRRATAIQEATAASQITTTSATFILATGMTVTPEAGTYLAMFTADVENDTNNAEVHIALYVGGSVVPNTDTYFEAKDTGALSSPPTNRSSLTIHRVLTPNGSQAVEARWRVTAGTGTMGSARSLHLLRVG